MRSGEEKGLVEETVGRLNGQHMLDNCKGRDETVTPAHFVLFELVAQILHSPHRYLPEVRETITESLSACYP